MSCKAKSLRCDAYQGLSTSVQWRRWRHEMCLQRPASKPARLPWLQFGAPQGKVSGISTFCLMGERTSGTTWIGSLLMHNFHMRLHEDGCPNKHDFDLSVPSEFLYPESNVLIVGVVRWAFSHQHRPRASMVSAWPVTHVCRADNRNLLLDSSLARLTLHAGMHWTGLQASTMCHGGLPTTATSASWTF